MLSEAPQMGQTIHAQQREPKHPENVTAVSIRVAYLKFVIPTAVKRARAVVSARVGRRDLVFSIDLGADLVLLSEAPQIGVGHPHTTARSQSIPRILKR